MTHNLPEPVISGDFEKCNVANCHLKRVRDDATHSGKGTIYHEPWWLDIATERRWSVVSVNVSGRSVAWMPYELKSSFGITKSVMPLATNFLGPVLEASSGGPATRLRRQLALTSELIGKLPKVTWFSQVFHSEVDNVIPFQDAGYMSSVRHSILVDPVSKNIIWMNMLDKTRNAIRKSEQKNAVEDIHDPDEFVFTYKENLRIANLNSYLDFKTISLLLTETMARNRGRIVGLRDANRNLHTAIFYIWDYRTAYYNLSTRSCSRSDNGSVSQLIWAAIQDSASNGRTFDFDGVWNNGARRFYSGFGGRVVSRYCVEKGAPMYNVTDALLRFASGRLRRQMFR